MTPYGFAAFAIAALVLSLAADPAYACREGRCAERNVVESEYRKAAWAPPVAIVVPERVMVARGRVDKIETSPETVTVIEEIDMLPAGYRWEDRRCPPGTRRCKVFVPAESKFVERDVVMQPGRRVSVVTPPTYEWRGRPAAVSPGVAVSRSRALRRDWRRSRVRARGVIPPGGWIGW